MRGVTAAASASTAGQAVGGRGRDANEPRPRGREGGFISGVARLDHQNLVAGLEQREGGGEQPVLGARHHHDVVGLRRHAGAAALQVGHGGAERGPAGDRGIMGVAGPQRRDGALDDRGGGGEIRVADAEQDDILPPRFRLPRRLVDVPGGPARGIEAVDERGEAHEVGLSGGTGASPNAADGGGPPRGPVPRRRRAEPVSGSGRNSKLLTPLAPPYGKSSLARGGSMPVPVRWMTNVAGTPPHLPERRRAGPRGAAHPPWAPAVAFGVPSVQYLAT